MVCLLAILLFTGQELAQKDRLVITTTELRRPTYFIYEANHEQPFVVPDRRSGIYRTSVNINGPGTYVAVYCSITVPIDDLRGIVSDGLTTLPSRIGGRFGNDEKSENECFEYVNDLYFESDGEGVRGRIQRAEVVEPDPLPVSHLIKSHQCTKRLLISLAYQRRILCAAGYGFETTYRDEHLPTIIFDEPVEIADAIYEGQFVMRQDQVSTRNVLAWNQGQLQSFIRHPSSRNWMERTYIGNEPHSGRHITVFIKSNNAQVRQFMNQFNKLEDSNFGGSGCFGIHFKALLNPLLCREFKFKHRHVIVDRLDPIPAEGRIDGIRITKPMQEDEGRIMGQIS